MNTASTHVPFLKKSRSRDYVFCLEELELAFPRQQLDEITKAWNDGADLEYLAKKYQRLPDEILLALFHQARNGKTKRPFAFRKQ